MPTVQAHGDNPPQTFTLLSPLLPLHSPLPNHTLPFPLPLSSITLSPLHDPSLPLPIHLSLPPRPFPQSPYSPHLLLHTYSPLSSPCPPILPIFLSLLSPAHKEQAD